MYIVKNISKDPRKLKMGQHGRERILQPGESLEITNPVEEIPNVWKITKAKKPEHKKNNQKGD